MNRLKVFPCTRQQKKNKIIIIINATNCLAILHCSQCFGNNGIGYTFAQWPQMDDTHNREGRNMWEEQTSCYPGPLFDG